ncbi:MAG: hypothetical protein R3B13_15035 [Polyangiaceae bacterium]
MLRFRLLLALLAVACAACATNEQAVGVAADRRPSASPPVPEQRYALGTPRDVILANEACVVVDETSCQIRVPMSDAERLVTCADGGWQKVPAPRTAVIRFVFDQQGALVRVALVEEFQP